MRTIFFVALAVAGAVAAPGPASAQTGTPVGKWLTQQGDATIRISRCGAGVCGRIVGLREPNDDATGKPALDKNNPNPALRHRPLIGLPLMPAMRPAGPNQWKGPIYNSDDGKTYQGGLSMSGSDGLRVEGCDGILCGSELWKRVR